MTHCAPSSTVLHIEPWFPLASHTQLPITAHMSDLLRHTHRHTYAHRHIHTCKYRTGFHRFESDCIPSYTRNPLEGCESPSHQQHKRLQWVCGRLRAGRSGGHLKQDGPTRGQMREGEKRSERGQVERMLFVYLRVLCFGLYLCVWKESWDVRVGVIKCLWSCTCVRTPCWN